ncbi:Hypothetical protein FSTVST1_183 [Faustovirus ST1]|nr:Hypothetical protein FSTVST1_183 [Faustovirus ST1]
MSLTLYDIFAMLAITVWFVLAIHNIYLDNRTDRIIEINNTIDESKLNIIKLNGN